MNATQQLHALGQSLWLDNITHALLTSGTLARYIGEFAVTGLTSNPTIFEHAIKNGGFYVDALHKGALAGMSNEALFFELGLDPRIASVASVFVSRWDVAVKDKVPNVLRNRLGIAVAMGTYKAYRELLMSTRWQKLVDAQTLAADLQREGTAAFVQSWNQLMLGIASTRAQS